MLQAPSRRDYVSPFERSASAPVPNWRRWRRTGTCSKRRPRRDYVSPFEPEGSPVDGEHGIPDNPNGPTPNGVEQICNPFPARRQPPVLHRTLTPLPKIAGFKSTPGRLRRPPPPAGDTRGGKKPSPATRACSCSPERATENSPGVQPGDQRRAQSESRQGRKKMAPGFNPGFTQPQRPQVP